MPNLPNVIIRHGSGVNENGVYHQDEPSTYEHAEKVAGHRLDRRRKYAIIDGQVHELARWTEECSGCTEYSMGHKIYGPAGCHECGYTGKRRHQMWVPTRDPEGPVLTPLT